MMSHIDELREQLLKGIRLSGQSSYVRRAPRRNALPHLNSARNGLRVLVQNEPRNADAWELLSRAEECCLNYSAAISALERACELRGQKQKSDLKRLALLSQSKSEWERLPISAEDLAELGEFLESVGADRDASRRSFDFTRQWLETHKRYDAGAVIAAFEARGAFSDFQVFHNVVRG